MLALRPEHVRIEPSGTGTIRARVKDVVFRGSYFAYELTALASGAVFFAYRQDRIVVPEDGVVDLGWSADRAVLLEDQP